MYFFQTQSKKLDSLFKLQWLDLFILKLATDVALFLLDNGGPGIKKKIVVITAGVTVFGLIITCFCILIVKNPGKYMHNLASIIGN